MYSQPAGALPDILRRLKEAGRTAEERPLLAEWGGFGTNVIVRYGGGPADAEGSGAEGVFVLAVPQNKGFAVETALAFIKAAGERGAAVSLMAAFLADEENTLPRDLGGTAHKGLQDLLSIPDMPENWVLCYLDMEGPPGKILLRHGNGDYIAPLELVEPLAALFAAEEKASFEFEIGYSELYKLGLVSGPEELGLAWAAEVNGFCLSASGGEESGMTAEAMAELLLDYAGHLRFPVQNPDRHYRLLSLPGPGGIVFISERNAVVILLVTVAVFVFFVLLVSSVHRGRILFNFKLFVIHSWIFFIFLPLLVLALKGTGFIYSSLLSAFHKPAPSGGDYTGAGLAILFAIWLAYIPSHFFDCFHFLRRQNFYATSALILAALGLFIAAYIDFTYAPVFMWAFICTAAGAYSRNLALVFISALLMPLEALGALYNLIKIESHVLTDIFLGNGPGSWAAALQIAVLSLPFLLLLKRGKILAREALRKKSLSWTLKIPLRIRVFFPAATLAAMIVYIVLLPKSGPEPLRRIRSVENSGGVVSISVTDTFFRESRIADVMIRAAGNPVRFNLYLENDENDVPLVYSAPFPFEAYNEKTTVFMLGENPPNPLNAEIVLPADLAGRLRAEAVYNVYDPLVDNQGRPDPAVPDYALIVRSETGLSTSGIPD